MTLLRIQSAAPLTGNRLRLTLTDGTTIERDVAHLLVGPVFEAIRSDPKVFSQVRVERGTVVWPGDVDLCPDVLIWDGPPPASSTSPRVRSNGVPQNQIDLTTDKALIGAAGVHFAASELSARGLIALPTIRNTAGIDIVVVNKSGTWQANLQVKTSRSKVGFWPVGKHFDAWRGPNNFYVFARYLKDERRFEAFLETANGVADQLQVRIADEKKRGLKEWAPCWHLQGEEERLRRQWIEFGRGKA